MTEVEQFDAVLKWAEEKLGHIIKIRRLNPTSALIDEYDVQEDEHGDWEVVMGRHRHLFAMPVDAVRDAISLAVASVIDDAMLYVTMEDNPPAPSNE